MKIWMLILVSTYGIFAKQDCKPKYHYWRPYNGSIPSDAFIAGKDDSDKLSYIGRIHLPFKHSWTVPVQLRKNQDHVDFAWCCNTTSATRVDEFIEILCVDKINNIAWVKADSEDAKGKCCLIEGGVGWWNRRNTNAKLHIGKAVLDDVTYIGMTFVYDNIIPQLQFMNGSNATYVDHDFDVLTYDCNFKKLK